MRLRPYLTFAGQCREALALYTRAFDAEPGQVMLGSQLPNAADLPAEQQDWVVQAVLPLGDDLIRLSDCFGPLNDPESERLSIAVECDVATVERAFAALAEEGRVGIPLATTFYSPLAGVVFDKFGVMWNFVGQP